MEEFNLFDVCDEAEAKTKETGAKAKGVKNTDT